VKRKSTGAFLATNELEELVAKNIGVLRTLYDEDRGVFNCRLYIDSYPDFLNSFLVRNWLIMHVSSVALPQTTVYRGKDILVDPKEDLKYVGHVIVGLSRYCTFVETGCNDLLGMIRSSLEYLARYQTKKGALRCRYVNSCEESGTDPSSMAEATESFLWAAGAARKVFGNEETQSEALLDRAMKAGKWLTENKQFLSPQEIGRSIYGLSELADTRYRKEIFLWVKCLLDDLVQRLSASISFGSFPNDIDTIGGFSVGSYVTGQKVFMSNADRLVQNQLANQGAAGQWRWRFGMKNGLYRWTRDVTYSVHQLGMAPWALSAYLLASSSYRSDVEESAMNGICWILTKLPFIARFIVRSFSGLTGRALELEQRAYEPGLNLLGLLSCCLVKGLRSKSLPLEYFLRPDLLTDHYGLRPWELAEVALRART
jgi:hypothetical protein